MASLASALARGVLAGLAVGTLGDWAGPKVVILAAIAAFSFGDLARREQTDGGPAVPDPFGVLMQLAFLVVLCAAAWDNRLGDAPMRLAGLIELTGSVILLAGVWLRQSALRVMGRHFTVRLRVLSDHRLVTDGPYRLVRHPNYAALALVGIGTALVMRSATALLATLAVWLPLVLARIGHEEWMLRRNLGAEYTDYARRTWRLIPGLF